MNAARAVFATAGRGAVCSILTGFIILTDTSTAGSWSQKNLKTPKKSFNWQHHGSPIVLDPTGRFRYLLL